ncbi:MAG: HD domain-containing protein [Chloroflexi bacterium]|nr:HD domain-containing protein [Chloroflexota bacterium]
MELDKAKGVLRRNLIPSADRRENDAEHGWHVTMFALVLADYAPPGADISRVIAMLLVHDIVEIDAGDAFVYDEEAKARQPARERAAADRLYGILPPGQGRNLRSLWEEFEARQTPEARFAAALDRLQPLLLNFHTRGRAWRHHGVTRDQVLAVNAHIADGSKALWGFARSLIDEAVRLGYLSP